MSLSVFPPRPRSSFLPLLRRPHLPANTSLAIGSPLSELDLLTQKVTAINAKHGPFDACVIIGDLFKADSDGSELDSVARSLQRRQS